MPESTIDFGVGLVVVAALVAGYVRGLSGFGSALVLAPPVAAAYGAKAAVPVALILELVIALPFVRGAARTVVDRRRLAVLCVSPVVTLPIGAWVLVNVDPADLRWIMSATVLTFVGILAAGWSVGERASTRATAFAGGLSGLLNGSMGMGGPPVVVHHLASSSPPAQIRASLMLYFAWLDSLALVAMAVAGALTPGSALLALVLSGPLLLGAAIGARQFRRTSTAAYRRFALVVLTGVAIVSVAL